MITEQQALSLLDKYNLPSSRINHSKGVASFANELALAIKQHHPELDIDPDKVRIAALLHDVGRGMEGDHELNSVRILKQEGLADLADIVMHGSMYELSVIHGAPDESLLPRTIENKIVAYADTRFKDSLVSLNERFNEVLERRRLEKEKSESVKMAAQRYDIIEKELMELAS
ncbi:MAG TPA: HD domain-containing protein [Chitinivibrionales bacterium]|jgi:putative nucleotidyltransferase with HDIG domain|nr:HD domain-containing protein [Chitinivibrionales bacterium]